MNKIVHLILICMFFLSCAVVTRALPSVKLASKLHDSGDGILRTRHWYAALKSDQTYLGSATLRLRRAEGDFANLTDHEWRKLKDIIGIMQKAASRAFRATNYNWSCLMNHAFKSPIPIPLVHIHFHPRYESERVFAGVTFSDKEFGKHYKPYTQRRVPNDVQKKIIRAYRQEINHLQREYPDLEIVF